MRTPNPHSGVLKHIAEQAGCSPSTVSRVLNGCRKGFSVRRDLEERMKGIMGTKVCVNRKANGRGKIEIEYYSDEELERLFEMIMSIKEGVR